MAFWDALGNILMIFFKGVGILFAIGIVFEILKFFLSPIKLVYDAIVEGIKEGRWKSKEEEEEKRAITDEERLKRAKAELEFMRKHPGTRC